MALRLLDLSQDVAELIALYLRTPSILALSSTCKALRQIIHESSMWETLCIRDFRINPNSFPRSAAGWQEMYKNMKSPIVLTWGVNQQGRLKQNRDDSVWHWLPNVSTPTEVDTSECGRISTISCSGFGMHALNQNGEVWFWGTLGECGARTTGFKIPLPEPCVSVSSGRTFGCALGDSGKAYAWTDESYSNVFVVKIVECNKLMENGGQSLSKVKCIAAGWSHVALIHTDGSIVTCHIDSLDHIQKTASFHLPETSADPVDKLAAGCDVTYALTVSGRLIAWEDIGSAPTNATPATTDLALSLSGETFTHMSACLHNLALYDSSTGRCRLFDNRSKSDITPQWMANHHDIVKTTNGDWHGGALLSNGQVWTWGNGSCALGLGRDDEVPVREPQQITNGFEGLFVFDIAFGGWHSAALAFRVTQ